MKFAEFDCTDDSTICAQSLIQAFPTVILYLDNDEPMKYTWPRQAQEFVNWLK